MRRNMKKACYGQELLRNRPRLFFSVTQISFDYGIWQTKLFQEIQHWVQDRTTNTLILMILIMMSRLLLKKFPIVFFKFVSISRYTYEKVFYFILFNLKNIDARLLHATYLLLKSGKPKIIRKRGYFLADSHDISILFRMVTSKEWLCLNLFFILPYLFCFFFTVFYDCFCFLFYVLNF